MSKYFLVGIGGIGMQAVARLLKSTGAVVSGSDMRDFEERAQLEAEGIKVFVGHDAAHIEDDLTAVIYSTAVPTENPEIEAAKAKNIPLRRRLGLVGEMMKDRLGIAVTGTHGKTTTTTMIATILKGAGLDPTALIGAELRSLKSNTMLGKGNAMVVEACEYTRCFLDLSPKIIVITNIEEDHLDYYADLDDIKRAFREFVELLPTDGLVIANGDDANTRNMLQGFSRRIIFVGFNADNDVKIENAEYVDGQLNFSIDGQRLFLQVPGRHNVSNAALAWVAARQLGVEDEVIAKLLAQDFRGAARRFEILGEASGVTFVDDYGHHPTEIQATLEAAKNYFPNRRVVVVFHPHQYSRTMILLSGFARSFKDCGLVLVAPIFPARFNEEKQYPVTSEKLVEEINKVSGNAKFVGDFPEIAEFLKKELKAGDVLLTLGAGKADVFGREFLADWKYDEV